MIGRLVAGGIGVAGVPGQRQRLAAAAAPVDLAPVARAAGLAHPFRAAEGLEGGVRAPDVAKRMIAHVPEFEARNGLGGVARQRLAGRRDIDRDPPPAARARLRIAGVIVGDHHVDDQLALEARPRLLHQRDRFFDLLPSAASARRDWRAPSRNIAYGRFRAGARRARPRAR